MRKFRFLPHTSEVKFKAYGKTLDNAFENAALALSQVIAKENKIRNTAKKEIKVRGENKENLLYSFLEEILYLFDAEHFIVAKAEVKINENNLKATLYGDDSSNYKSLGEVKAITYSEMQIKKVSSGWEVQVVVDV